MRGLLVILDTHFFWSLADTLTEGTDDARPVAFPLTPAVAGRATTTTSGSTRPSETLALTLPNLHLSEKM